MINQYNRQERIQNTLVHELDIHKGSQWAVFVGTVPTPVSCMGIGWVQAQSWTTFSTHNFNAHASEAKVCGMLLP